jgi:hypothetical protein
MPAVHVNHKQGRFTNHGEVCYDTVAYTDKHPHWGAAQNWWPGEVKQVVFEAPPAGGGCGCQKPAPQPEVPAVLSPVDLEKAYEQAAQNPSDFHEHVPTLRDLASSCKSAVELSLWYKPSDIALAQGLPPDGELVSVSPGNKPGWGAIRTALGGRFKGESVDPHARAPQSCDLLFVDTRHDADTLFPILKSWQGSVAKYLAVHCTVTFGEVADSPNKAGVMYALRAFCKDHPEWVVKRRDENNHGLVVLSKCLEDVKELPSLWRKAMNYSKAMLRHAAAGKPLVTDAVLEKRQAECAVCEYRALDACAACGCPLEAKLPLATEKCGLVKLGKPLRWDAVTDPDDIRKD